VHFTVCCNSKDLWRRYEFLWLLIVLICFMSIMYELDMSVYCFTS
jgi:hypothetical protein